LLIIGLPLGLYGLGLSNIDGRPEPPVRTNSIPADTTLLQHTFRSQAPIVVHALNPWTYAVALVTGNANDLLLDNGSHAIWLIVRNYNSKHLINRGMLSWHLSGAALMIWVSRNWATDEVVTAAAATIRPYQDQQPP
jgi:hypothetical protein